MRQPASAVVAPDSPLSILLVFLRLGLTSFGGPVAHLGYFRAEFVERRRWLDERGYADLVALCQLLPGPASSQVGLAVGLLRGGLPGAGAAWLGFTLPSAVLMILFAYGVASYGEALGSGWLHGLKLVALAVVAQAVWAMARSLCPDRLRGGFALVAAIVLLLADDALAQVGVILAGGLAGRLLLAADEADAGTSLPPVTVGRRLASLLLLLFFVLLGALPLLAAVAPGHPLDLLDAFYRSGALVFGGGHVVLPLLQAEVVPPGWIGADSFLAGYGAAQALPGPLFTFSAYLGAAMTPAPNGIAGALLCLLAIFAPSFLLTIGMLPFWASLRARRDIQAALKGVNAAVVGLLLAALYDPVFTSAVTGPRDFALALAAFLLLALARWQPWLVVILGALAGAGLAAV